MWEKYPPRTFRGRVHKILKMFDISVEFIIIKFREMNSDNSMRAQGVRHPLKVGEGVWVRF